MTANAINGFLHAEKKWQNHQVNNPVTILVLNLMPTKRDTEYQFLTNFNRLDTDVTLTFMYPYSHQFKGTSRRAIEADYVCWNQIADRYYDGLIITGAPIEKLAFHQVDYFDELKQIIQWVIPMLSSSSMNAGPPKPDCFSTLAFKSTCCLTNYLAFSPPLRLTMSHRWPGGLAPGGF